MSNENLSELRAIEVKAHEQTLVVGSGFQLWEGCTHCTVDQEFQNTKFWSWILKICSTENKIS